MSDEHPGEPMVATVGAAVDEPVEESVEEAVDRKEPTDRPSARAATIRPVGDRLEASLEGLLFVADEALTVPALAAYTEADETDVTAALERLAARLEADGRGVAVRAVAGGWRMSSAPVARVAVEQFVLAGRSGRLTQAALETLAVIAYKQPISRVEISEIRGVNADGAVRSLASRGLIEAVGHDDGPGQAVLYGTTATLLEKLGLDSLDELPELTEFLPEQPAPDEPASVDLRRAREVLAAGRDLPATGRPQWDAETSEDRPLRRRDDDEMRLLTERLERAARAATDQLKAAVEAAEATDDPDVLAEDTVADEDTEGTSHGG